MQIEPTRERSNVAISLKLDDAKENNLDKEVTAIMLLKGVLEKFEHQTWIFGISHSIWAFEYIPQFNFSSEQRFLFKNRAEQGRFDP